MTIIGELFDREGNSLALGETVLYATPDGDRTAVLTWDMHIGAVLLLDTESNDVDVFYEIGADAVTKVDVAADNPSPPVIVLDGRIAAGPGFVLASVPQQLLGLHFEVKGELLGYPIYVPIGADR